MEILVEPSGFLTWQTHRVRCALGRGGIRIDKREGDGATPAGAFPLRRLLFRADRLAKPVTGLPAEAIRADDGWCDDPRNPSYNRPVRLPFAASHEKLWRADALYDLVAVVGHNDNPPVPGMGSAIFLHVAKPDWGPTEGCVALTRDDFLRLLAACDETTSIRIPAP